MPNTTTNSAADAQDALNLAGAYIAKVTSETNDLLSKLRKGQITALNKLVTAMYSSAKATLYSAVCEGLMNFGMAAGGLSALKDVDNAQSEATKVSSQEKTLQDSKTSLEKQIEDKKFSGEETKESVQKDLDIKTKKLTTIQGDKKEKERTKSQRANNKSQIYAQASPAVAALPKASQEAIQNQAGAVKEIMQQINGMLSSSYDKANSTVQSMLSLNNLFGAIAGLTAINLR